MGYRIIETGVSAEREEIQPADLVNAESGGVYIPTPDSAQSYEWEDYMDVHFVKTIGGGITTARHVDNGQISVIVWTNDEIELWEGSFLRTSKDFVFGYQEG